jgi:hypothetical protein
MNESIREGKDIKNGLINNKESILFHIMRHGCTLATFGILGFAHENNINLKEFTPMVAYVPSLNTVYKFVDAITKQTVANAYFSNNPLAYEDNSNEISYFGNPNNKQVQSKLEKATQSYFILNETSKEILIQSACIMIGYAAGRGLAQLVK